MALGYDTSNNATLWKDRVALEMNAAVLHSFKLANATIVDQVVQFQFVSLNIFDTEVFNVIRLFHILKQACTTNGPRAKCGPRRLLIWPAQP